MRPKTSTIPLSRPPCPIGLVMLELSTEKHSDEELVDRSLNGNDSD